MTSLARVRQAAKKAAVAREELRIAIREATVESSLREVATAAGLSHEQVRRLSRSDY